MTEDRIKTLTFAAIAALALGADLDGGKFAGVTTLKDGTHCAVVVLPNKADERLEWNDAMAWAKEAGGQLPMRPVAALLYANAKDQFERTWYWTSDELQADTGEEGHASYAWNCFFSSGFQSTSLKGAAGACVAVRLIPLVL